MATKTAWGGRFQEPTDAHAARFLESVSFDQRLADEDIAGSLAHAQMLQAIGVLTEADLAAIQRGLGQIRAEVRAGTFEWDAAKEDVHMNVESTLTAREGDVGARLHTGRSRNDQVATDMRLWARDACTRVGRALDRLALTLVARAEGRSTRGPPRPTPTPSGPSPTASRTTSSRGSRCSTATAAASTTAPTG